MKKKLAPLRKIVEFTWEALTPGGTEIRKEKLECGHTQAIKSDIYGQTHPVRRRCRKCLKNVRN